jgi:hypothetical protein
VQINDSDQKKILLTGASGFVGERFREMLGWKPIVDLNKTLSLTIQDVCPLMKCEK